MDVAIFDMVTVNMVTGKRIQAGLLFYVHSDSIWDFSRLAPVNKCACQSPKLTV